MKRGGSPNIEKYHGKNLSKIDVVKAWGRGNFAGEKRVERCSDWIIDSCKFLEGQTVLECGCGTGIFTSRIVHTKAQILAVDISEDLLAIAKTNVVGSNVNFLLDDLETLNEVPDSFFEALYGVSVLHHLDLFIALSALKKKAKEGARFAFSEPNMGNPINNYIFCSNNPDVRKNTI